MLDNQKLRWLYGIKGTFILFKNKKIRINFVLFGIANIKYNIKNKVLGLDFGIIESREHNIFACQDSGPIVETILSFIDIHPTDTILDIGSGKGGTVIAFSKHQFKHVGGIEIYKNIYEISKKNISKTSSKNITVYLGDARFFDKYDDYNFFYVFNPFSEIIMKGVLDKIRESYTNRKRRIVLIYLNPVYHNIVSKSGIFTRYIAHNVFSTNYKLFNIYSNDLKEWKKR